MKPFFTLAAASIVLCCGAANVVASPPLINPTLSGLPTDSSTFVKQAARMPELLPLTFSQKEALGPEYDEWIRDTQPIDFVKYGQYQGWNAILKCPYKSAEYNAEVEALAKVKNALGPNVEVQNILEKGVIPLLDNFKPDLLHGCLVFPNAQNFLEYWAKVEKADRFKWVVSLARQLVTNVAFLHSIGVAHTDIKPANFLVYFPQPGEPKLILANFRYAKTFDQSGRSYEFRRVDCHTLAYCAPEVVFDEVKPVKLRSKLNLFKVDAWSAGSSIYEMLTDRPPYGVSVKADFPLLDGPYEWSKGQLAAVFNNVIAGIHSYRPIDWSQAPPNVAYLNHVLDALMQPLAAKRSTLANVVKKWDSPLFTVRLVN